MWFQQNMSNSFEQEQPQEVQLLTGSSMKSTIFHRASE